MALAVEMRLDVLNLRLKDHISTLIKLFQAEQGGRFLLKAVVNT